MAGERPPIELAGGDTLVGILVGIGLSAAAGLRLFVPLAVVSAASLSGHLELAGDFEWLGSPAALVGFTAAAAIEVAAYLVPFLDNALDALAGPAAGVAGTALMASSVVEVDEPLLRWTLAVVAGGGVASVIQLLTGATRLTSSVTTAGLGNPALAASEAGGALGVSLLAIALPVAGAVVALALAAVAVRAVARSRRLFGRRR